jgi:hypothetical protein
MEQQFTHWLHVLILLLDLFLQTEARFSIPRLHFLGLMQELEQPLGHQILET